jgi:hypothetical protein
MIPPDPNVGHNITAISAEDLQDEDKMRKIMKAPPLTEADVRLKDEKIAKLQVEHQK